MVGALCLSCCGHARGASHYRLPAHPTVGATGSMVPTTHVHGQLGSNRTQQQQPPPALSEVPRNTLTLCPTPPLTRRERPECVWSRV